MDHLFAFCTFASSIWDLFPSTVPTALATGSIAKWFWQEASTGPSSTVCLSTDWGLPPPPGCFTLNFDHAYDVDTGKAGIRGLFRDEYGTMILAYTAELRANHPLEVELMALQRGLVHLSELSCPAIQVEGDCLSLVTNVRKSSHLRWDVMPLWRRTMHLLREASTWTIRHCKRTANRAADMLVEIVVPKVHPTSPDQPPNILFVVNEE